MHPLNAAFAKKYPTIEHYIHDEAEQNKMSQYLLGPDIPEDKQQIIDLLDERYCFIGLQERYPVSFLLLSNILWKSSLPKAKKQRVLQNDTALEMRKKFAHIITEKNAIDLKIYQIISKRYDKIADIVWRNIKARTEG